MPSCITPWSNAEEKKMNRHLFQFAASVRTHVQGRCRKLPIKVISRGAYNARCPLPGTGLGGRNDCNYFHNMVAPHPDVVGLDVAMNHVRFTGPR